MINAKEPQSDGRNSSKDSETTLLTFKSLVSLGAAIVSIIMAGLFSSADRTDREDLAYIWFMLFGVSLTFSILLYLYARIKAQCTRINRQLDAMDSDLFISHREMSNIESKQRRHTLAKVILCVLGVFASVATYALGVSWFRGGLVFTAHVWFMLVGDVAILIAAASTMYFTMGRLRKIENRLNVKTQSGDSTGDR